MWKRSEITRACDLWDEGAIIACFAGVFPVGVGAFTRHDYLLGALGFGAFGLVILVASGWRPRVHPRGPAGRAPASRPVWRRSVSARRAGRAGPGFGYASARVASAISMI
ncbi:MAG TPA: hypothetical protein VF808_13925 [Ktedonobacterales bacterium]